MAVTLLGILIVVSSSQPLKAAVPMVVTLLGIVVFLQPTIRVFVSVSIMALQLSLESYFELPVSTVMEASPGHCENASFPMEVTPLGIVIAARAEQEEKALLEIVTTLVPMTTEDKAEQP